MQATAVKCSKRTSNFGKKNIQALAKQTSDWSRAFNQFTKTCELDMINATSAADIAFIMSRSAWLLSPLECSPQNLVSVLSAEAFASADNSNLGFDNS